MHLFWCYLQCLMLAYLAGQHASKGRTNAQPSGETLEFTNAMSIGKLKRFVMPKELSSVPEEYLR